MPFFNKFGGGSARTFGLAKSKAKREAEFLVIAGGGAGAYNGGGGGPGGGGAGGYRTSVPGETSGGGSASEAKAQLTIGETYAVTVGGGGARAADCDNIGGRGVNSSIIGDEVSIVSLGGGGGGYANVKTSTNAGEVGSGGGLAGYCCGALTVVAPGTPGQGTNGGMQFSSTQGGGGRRRWSRNRWWHRGFRCWWFGRLGSRLQHYWKLGDESRWWRWWCLLVRQSWGWNSWSWRFWWWWLRRPTGGERGGRNCKHWFWRRRGG